MPVKRTDLSLLIGIDILNISGADDIRKAIESGDLDRPKKLTDMTWFFRNYFKYSRHYDVKKQDLFLAISSPPDREERATACRKFFQEGEWDDIVDKYVPQIVDLLEMPVAEGEGEEIVDRKLRRLCMQVMGSRFSPVRGEPVPNEMLDKAESQIVEIPHALNPCIMHKASIDVPPIYEYFDNCIKAGGVSAINSVDATHGFMTMHVFGALLCRAAMKDIENDDVSEVFANGRFVKEGVRVPIRETTLGGLLPKPITPNQTVVFIDLPSAYNDSQDKLYASSGNGDGTRVCCARPALLELMTKIRIEVLRRREERIAAAS